MDKTIADAVAEEITTHSNEHLATKADIAMLIGEIEKLTAQVRLLTGLVIGLYVGFAVLFVDKVVG